MTGITRRKFFAASVLGGVSVLSGCTGNAGKATPVPGEPPADSPIQEVGFDGGDMVVSLREEHAVSRLNLIGPDGSAVAQTTVASGETTSRLEILDIRPGLGGYDHYEPGQHELVAIRDEETTSFELELVPELRITDVAQYRDGDRNSDFGKLAVTVENIGTAPTWVYAISYQDAPNHLVNDPLNTNPGIPILSKPKAPEQSIIGPDTSQTYIGDTAPLVFTDREKQLCGGEFSFRVLIGIPANRPIEGTVNVSVDGSVLSAGLTGDYACSELSINIGANGATDGN